MQKIIFIFEDAIQTNLHRLTFIKMAKLLQSKASQESQKAPCISIRGQIMIVNGEPVPYEKQMLTNHNFFLTDHGIDLPFDSGIDEFDRKYFDFLLITKVIKEIESSHPKVGRQILQNLPQLSEKSYINIILKLSLTKIRYILMDNNFYLFLWIKIMALAKYSQEQIQKAAVQVQCCLSELQQPEKRALYMLQYLQGSQAFISALRITGTQLLEEYVNSSKYLSDLLQRRNRCQSESQGSENGPQPGKYYLKNIKDAYYSLMLVPIANQQTYEILKPKGQRSFFPIFKRQCLKVIMANFDQYFNYQRNNLIEVLSLVAIENGQELWPEIISKRYIPQAPSSVFGSSENTPPQAQSNSLNSKGNKSSDGATDNESTFVLLMVNNFLQPGQPQWQQSLLILQTIIKFNGSEAKNCLMRIFIETAKHSFSSSIADLTLNFLNNSGNKEGTDKKIEIFLLQFISIVNCNILEDFNFHKDRLSFRAKTKFTRIQNERFISYLRIYGTIFDRQVIEIFHTLSCKSVLQRLFAMTKTAKGITAAVRKSLIKKIQKYFIEAEIQQQHYLRLTKCLEKISFGRKQQMGLGENKDTQFINFLRSLIQE